MAARHFSFETLVGRLVITPKAREKLSTTDVTMALRRHWRVDSGDFSSAGRRNRERTEMAGCKLLSAYCSGAGQRFWIITEADKSVTTVLLPEDY